MNRELLRENRIHGDRMFPFGVYTMNHIGSQEFLDCHWHDEMELLLVNEGCAVFQVDTSHYTVSAGEAIFVNSGRIHGGYAHEDNDCLYSAAVFSPGLLLGNSYDSLQAKYLDPLLKNRLLMPVHIRGESPWEKEALGHIGKIIETGFAKPYAYELQIKAHIYLTFATIFSGSELAFTEKKPTATAYKAEKLKEILTYIQCNYNKRITIGELSARLNMSEGHFCRFFKQMFRRTPIDYINYYRISMAAKLLGDGRKKIIEVAMDVGFDNCSYFINIFKKYMKCTPSEYRKLYCDGEEDT